MGNDETVALTAFVVIALHHGLAVFQDENAQQLKDRVVRKRRSVLPARPSLPWEPGHAGLSLCSLLGSLHHQGKLVLGAEGKCWAPG